MHSGSRGSRGPTKLRFVNPSHAEVPFIVTALSSAGCAFSTSGLPLFCIAYALLLQPVDSFRKVQLLWQCLEPSEFLLHLLEEKGM